MVSKDPPSFLHDSVLSDMHSVKLSMTGNRVDEVDNDVDDVVDSENYPGIRYPQTSEINFNYGAWKYCSAWLT